MKLLIVMSCLIGFSSCQMLNPQQITPEEVEVVESQPVCIWKNPSQNDECDVEYWLKFWYEIEEVSWKERKSQILSLSEQDSDLLKKVLLSQGKSTPFQDRLRAQNWVETILPKLSQHMRRFILVALYQPSQDLLEMESALVTLSNINTHQSTTIEEQQTSLNKQQTLLDKQQNQIEQLLNIETSIIQNNEKDKE